MDHAFAAKDKPGHDSDRLISRLVAAIGPQAVQVSYLERRFFSQDVFRSGVLPVAVVQPKSVEDVQRCAALCNEAGAAIIPRGGGLSYTDGYLPDREGAVIFDLRALDKIVEIRADDMYVTVEAGCTWAALNEALAPLALRTPYWGPVSGLQATVGGALSQNSVFWGAVRHGVVAHNVLGLDLVLADGSVLGVGAHGGPSGAPPFFRHYGPELTGLFTGDCGALGLKVRATLPLIKRLPVKGAISFACAMPDAMLKALSEIGRHQLISESAMFDQGQQEARVSRPKVPLRRMLQTLLDVAKSDGPLAAMRVAVHGRSFLADVSHSLHLILEAETKAELQRQIGEIKRIVAGKGGWPIQPTIAQVLSARPFPPPSSTLSDSRFLPVHAIVPHSIAVEVYQRVLAIFAAHRSETESLGVRTGVFTVAVGAGTLLIEPTFHWEGAFLEAHARLYDKDAGGLPNVPANPQAQALVVELRDKICEMFLETGAGHLQIGKQYPFRRSRSEATWALLSKFKAIVDKKGVMNPGVLGFDR